MVDHVDVLAVASAGAPYRLLQQDVAAMAGAVFGERFREFERLSNVFSTAGIRERGAVRPMEWYMEPKGWPERTAAYIDGASRLFLQAARRALDQAGIMPSEVDIVVTVSSTGIATPSLEARAKGELGLRDDVQRVPVFGLGCAGGVTGLSLAARLARATPGATVLMVAVEVCTLSFRLDELTKANIVATALFGDGAAACVLRAGEEHGIARVETMGEHTWPDTLDIMGWNVDPTGFGVIFDRAIPPFAERHFGIAMERILKPAGVEIADVDRFICHPGGVKVIDALERALALDQGTLDLERDVLHDHGNMSAPTALFVLERAIGRGLPPRSVVTAMGPGFTASAISLLAA
jgi:alkylresorcinol/alkylpyrone synthase